MRKLRDIAFLARDFNRVVRGTDYFHQPLGLGKFFNDRRCYYSDMRGKARWNGPKDGGVPLLYVPALKRYIQFPIMILQYGLGSMDRWFTEGDTTCREQAIAAIQWTLSSLNSHGAFANYFPQILPTEPFHSDNSAMAQGQALSLLIRAVRYEFVDGAAKYAAEEAIDRIAANMLQTVGRGGTRLDVGPAVYFCEICRSDDYVVLNGWIFALFGLHDYVEWRQDDQARGVLEKSRDTLQRVACEYLLPCDWSFYDNHSRISSPFYHRLLIALVDAENRLATGQCYAEILLRLRRADTRWNNLWFIANKVKDKLFDSSLYATSGPYRAEQTPSQAA